jgi:meiotically up-regulated gene 157 (Mug157) protein
MSLLVQIMTSDDDEEIVELLNLLKSSTGGLGLMHESGTAF